MKRIGITFSILCTVYLTVAQPMKVAVLEPIGNVSNDIKTILREELAVAMVNQSKRFEILEKVTIDRMVKDQKFEFFGDVPQ